MIDREEAHRLLDAAFDHLEQEAAANNNAARAAAQNANLTVIQDFFSRAGWNDFFHRRAVTFIHGKPEGSPSEASELGPLVKNSRNFRRATARLLYDLGLLPGSLFGIWSLIMAEEGRDGAHGGGGVFEPDWSQASTKKAGPQLNFSRLSLSK